MNTDRQPLPPPPSGRSGWPWTEATPTKPGDWPRITVITPSYMQGMYIEETIRSVLQQGYPNLEYFVLDGGSTDETRAIIQKYEPWLSGWRSEKDAGQTATVNEGWRKASGELVAWLNSDDWYHPGALFAVAEAAKRVPNAGWFMGAVDDCAADGTPLKRQQPRAMTLAELLGRKNYGFHQPGMFWRRSLVEEIGPLDADLHNSFDHDFWARTLAAGHTLQAVDAPVACFRKHGNSKTGGNAARAMREDRVVFQRYAHLLPPEEYTMADKGLREVEADMLVTSVYQMLARQRRGDAFRQLLKHWPLIPSLRPPRLWFGAMARVLTSGRPPSWFSKP